MSGICSAHSVYQAPGPDNFRNRPRGRFGIYGGFTLIELLVVIAVIAVLAAIMFPVFAGAKTQAKQANCISNLKQISSAWQLYADNYSGRACPSYLYIGSTMCSWDFSATQSGWKAGLLGPYTKSHSLYSCPSYKLPADFDNTYGRPYTGYAYNSSYIGGDSLGRKSCLQQQIAQPSRTAVFADAGYDKPVMPQNYLRAPSDVEWFSGGTVHFRHAGYASVAWADGHVSASNKNYQSYTNNPSYHPENPECGALSPDDTAYDLK